MLKSKVRIVKYYSLKNNPSTVASKKGALINLKHPALKLILPRPFFRTKISKHRNTPQII